METDNNQPLTYYDEDTYKKQEQYDAAYKTGVGLSYAVLFIGMFCDKVNGVEIFGVWQVAFLSLSTINKVQPLLSPLMNLGLVNGLNFKMDFQSNPVPSRVSSLNY